MTRFAWAVVVLLVSSVALPAREVPVNLRDWAKKMEGRLAYGMYIGGKKCGWIVDEVKLGKHEGTEVVRVTSQSYMATLFDGEKSLKEETTLFCYALTGDGPIVFARQYQKEDGKELKRLATRHVKGL